MYYARGDENSYLTLQRQKSSNGRFFGKDLTNISEAEKQDNKRRGISTKRYKNERMKRKKSKLKKNPSQKNKRRDRSKSHSRPLTPEFRDKENVLKNANNGQNEISKRRAKDKFRSKITKLVKKKEKLRVKKTEKFLREKIRGRSSRLGNNSTSSRKLSPLTTKFTNEEIITPVNKQPKLENKPVDLERRARGIRKFDINQQIEKKPMFSSNNVLNALLQKVKEIETRPEKMENCGEFEEEGQYDDYIFRDPKEIFDSEANASFYISEKVKNIKLQEEMESYEIDYSEPGANFTSMKELNFARVWQMMLKEIVRILNYLTKKKAEIQNQKKKSRIYPERG